MTRVSSQFLFNRCRLRAFTTSFATDGLIQSQLLSKSDMPGRLFFVTLKRQVHALCLYVKVWSSMLINLKWCWSVLHMMTRTHLSHSNQNVTKYEYLSEITAKLLLSSPAANAPRGWDHHPESYRNCTPLHPTTLLGDDLSIAPDARLVAVPGDSADSKHARRHHPPHHPRFPPPVGCSCWCLKKNGPSQVLCMALFKLTYIFFRDVWCLL